MNWAITMGTWERGALSDVRVMAEGAELRPKSVRPTVSLKLTDWSFHG